MKIVVLSGSSSKLMMRRVRFLRKWFVGVGSLVIVIVFVYELS